MATVDVGTMSFGQFCTFRDKVALGSLGSCAWMGLNVPIVVTLADGASESTVKNLAKEPWTPPVPVVPA